RGVLETGQELADVGRVVRGHAQKLVKHPASYTHIDERFAQILTRVVTMQGHKVEEKRLHDPVIVDVVDSDPHEILVVGRCPAVERGREFAAYATQSLSDTALLFTVTHHGIALDGMP